MLQSRYTTTMTATATTATTNWLSKTERWQHSDPAVGDDDGLVDRDLGV
jgi:hypothetical protein